MWNGVCGGGRVVGTEGRRVWGAGDMVRSCESLKVLMAGKGGESGVSAN